MLIPWFTSYMGLVNNLENPLLSYKRDSYVLDVHWPTKGLCCWQNINHQFTWSSDVDSTANYCCELSSLRSFTIGCCAMVATPSTQILEKLWGRAQDQFQLFTTQCVLYMARRPMEFPDRQLPLFSFSAFWKKGAAKWAIPIIDNNDSILDNYANPMQTFKTAFSYTARMTIANW